MTLAAFKRNLKLFTVVTFLLSYGAVFFTLGKYQPGLSQYFTIKQTPIQQNTKESLEKPLPFVDTQSAKVISSFVKLCSNTLYGFEFAYPKDWFTTYDTQEQKCTLFAPFSFIVPGQLDNPFVPIKVEVVKTENWLETTKFYENPNDFQNILSVQNIEINSRLIHKVRAESTGGALIPRGLSKISFLIFDAKAPLVFTYQQLEESEKVEDTEKILEEMASTLRYF